VSEPIFLRDGERFVPTGHGRGPWDTGALHGGAPAALVAEVVQRVEPADGMAVARLTCEFLSAVPLAPLQVQARVVRPGRRLQLVEAELSAGDDVVLRARAVRLRRGAIALPPEATAQAGLPCEPPGAIEPTALASTASGMSEGFGLTGMELRFAGGTDFGLGPALTWFRLARPLVEGETPSPLARVVAAADFGNGVSHVLDWGEWLFVNTDLTLHLHREPAGEWVLLDARTHVEATGAGLAESRLFDEHGRIGLSAQSLFVDRR
jgi:acyl-Coa thioesterase superfamily protein/acyl-CoA thioesterase superfamily protein